MNKTSEFSSFVWPAKAERGRSHATLCIVSPQATVAALASAATALSGAMQGGGSHDVSMACIPFIVPTWPGADDDEEGNAASETDGLSARALILQRGLFGTCVAQVCVSALQFAMRDGMSGFVGCAVAALGTQACSPSGYRYLPTYIVLAFSNGTMQLLVNSEMVAAHGIFFSPATATGIKLAALVALTSPALMFTGLLIAWHLHCELRNIALSALPENMRAGLLWPGQPPVDTATSPPERTATDSFRPFAGQSRRLAEVK